MAPLTRSKTRSGTPRPAITNENPSNPDKGKTPQRANSVRPSSVRPNSVRPSSVRPISAVNTPYSSRPASPREPTPSVDIKDEPVENSVHDLEDNTIELITLNYKKRFEIMKKENAEANTKNKELQDIVSTQDFRLSEQESQIIQQQSKIEELEKNTELGAKLLEHNIVEHMRVKQR